MGLRRWIGVAFAASACGCVAMACSTFGSSGDESGTPNDAAPDGCTGTACGVGDGADVPDAGGQSDAADTVVAIRAGGGFGCAIRGSGAVSCWGRNNEGQVGQPPEGDLACDDISRCRSTPMLVPGLANVTHLAAGHLFACARTSDGAVSCWGANALGALGTPSATGGPKPTVVPGLPSALDVAAGSFNACARVSEDGGVAVYCWGTNREGLLGTVATGTIAGPTRIPALDGAKSVVLSRASEHACAILADDSVVCWGQNFADSLGHVVGQSGDVAACPGGGFCNHVPGPVGGPGFKATELALGLSFACARVVGTADVACWGYNALGSLGLGGASDTAGHATPTSVVGVTGATAITAGGTQACALVLGNVWCWGGNGLGELGNGNLSDPCFLGPCKTSAQAVVNLTGAVQIGAGFNSSFAMTADGTAWAWGGNPDGRLGHAPGASNDLLKCSANTGRCNPLPQAFAIP